MKYLGVDFGLKRIGLAISDGILASSLKILYVSSLSDAVEKINTEVKMHQVEKVIVGMPEGETGKATKRLVNGLKKVGLDITEADETLSTQNATKLMVEMGLKRKTRTISDDQAAAEILQNYLDNTV